MTECDLPTFEAKDFDLADPPECDMVMKGGITSGVVYPYAVLQIATKYRLKSIGGTSAGAIAAAFAAAAEYGRRHGRPEAFLALKSYCDELPERLSSLFQPEPELVSAFDLIRELAKRRNIRPLVRGWAPWAFGGGATGLSVGLLAAQALNVDLYGWLAGSAMTTLLGGVAASAGWARFRLIGSWRKVAAALRRTDYGFCTGLTRSGDPDTPALMDWMHEAIQDIAFGDPLHPAPLTFGNLRGSTPEQPDIDLRMVTTNLSMERPHTLPQLNLSAGFVEEEWRRLFPKSVMDHLCQRGGTSAWRMSGSCAFPAEEALPVIVAVRMSLSFPLLFAAVPLHIYDFELPRLLDDLEGIPRRQFTRALFSDGGLSSNFPIHMFDALLPARPTFAFSLEDLPVDETEVKERVTLPNNARSGMGVPVLPNRGFSSFAWQIFNSAKDWQDQLLSEITGQRERIARIYLTQSEGGLNLDMHPDASRKLMCWGYKAGCQFTDGTFDFEEHKWRRLLVLYSHLRESLGHAKEVWDQDFAEWYGEYLNHPKSFRSITLKERKRIGEALDLLMEWQELEKDDIRNSREKFPRRIGKLRIVPDY